MGDIGPTRFEAAIEALARAASEASSPAKFFVSADSVGAATVGARHLVFWLLDPGGKAAWPQPVDGDLVIEEGISLDCPPELASAPSQVVHGGRLLRLQPWNRSWKEAWTQAVSPEPTEIMAAPWQIGERVLGAVCAYGPLSGEGFSDEDGRVLRTLASVAAVLFERQVALGSADVAEAARDQAEHRLDRVLHAAHQLTAILEPETLVRVLVQQAMELLSARSGLAGLHKPEGMVCHAYQSLEGDMVPFELSWPPGRGVLGHVLLWRTPYMTNEAENDTFILPEIRDRFMVRQLICAPILNPRGEVLGAVELHNKKDGFDEEDLELLKSLAQLAAVGLENALAYQAVGELEQVKSDFLNLAAHELRGPVATARGYLTMLAEEGVRWPAAQQTQMLDTAMRKLDQIRFLVDQMLTTARIEDHRLLLEHTVLDLRRVVEDTAREVTYAIQPEHELILDVGSDPAPVRCDHRRTAAIIANLLDNAFKYSPEGGLVEVKCRVEPAGSVQVTVRDHGLGIAEEDLPRLFTRFGRIVTAQNSHIAGTGLGLYLSRRLALMHSGEISVESEPGVGTTFLLTLPLHVEEDKSEDEDPRSPDASSVA
jgi:signal transduction histidine kinase